MAGGAYPAAVKIPEVYKKSFRALEGHDVYYIGPCCKVNRRGTLQERIVVMTRERVYSCVANGGITRDICIPVITELMLQREHIALKIPGDYDLWLVFPNQDAALRFRRALCGLYYHITGSGLPLYEVPHQQRIGDESNPLQLVKPEGHQVSVAPMDQTQLILEKPPPPPSSTGSPSPYLHPQHHPQSSPPPPPPPEDDEVTEPTPDRPDEGDGLVVDLMQEGQQEGNIVTVPTDKLAHAKGPIKINLHITTLEGSQKTSSSSSSSTTRTTSSAVSETQEDSTYHPSRDVSLAQSSIPPPPSRSHSGASSSPHAERFPSSPPTHHPEQPHPSAPHTAQHTTYHPPPTPYSSHASTGRSQQQHPQHAPPQPPAYTTQQPSQPSTHPTPQSPQQQSYATPQPSHPSHPTSQPAQPSYSASQPPPHPSHTPSHPPSPTPQTSHPSYPTPQPSHPTPQPSYPPSQPPSHPAQDLPYPPHPSPHPSHPSPHPSHPSPHPSHPSPHPSHPSPHPSHPAAHDPQPPTPQSSQQPPQQLSHPPQQLSRPLPEPHQPPPPTSHPSHLSSGHRSAQPPSTQQPTPHPSTQPPSGRTQPGTQHNTPGTPHLSNPPGTPLSDTHPQGLRLDSQRTFVPPVPSHPPTAVPQSAEAQTYVPPIPTSSSAVQTSLPSPASAEVQTDPMRSMSQQTSRPGVDSAMCQVGTSNRPIAVQTAAPQPTADGATSTVSVAYVTSQTDPRPTAPAATNTPLPQSVGTHSPPPAAVAAATQCHPPPNPNPSPQPQLTGPSPPPPGPSPLPPNDQAEFRRSPGFGLGARLAPPRGEQPIPRAPEYDLGPVVQIEVPNADGTKHVVHVPEASVPNVKALVQQIYEAQESMRKKEGQLTAILNLTQRNNAIRKGRSEDRIHYLTGKIQETEGTLQQVHNELSAAKAKLIREKELHLEQLTVQAAPMLAVRHPAAPSPLPHTPFDHRYSPSRPDTLPHPPIHMSPGARLSHMYPSTPMTHRDRRLSSPVRSKHPPASEPPRPPPSEGPRWKDRGPQKEREREREPQVPVSTTKAVPRANKTVEASPRCTSVGTDAPQRKQRRQYSHSPLYGEEPESDWQIMSRLCQDIEQRIEGTKIIQSPRATTTKRAAAQQRSPTNRQRT